MRFAASLSCVLLISGCSLMFAHGPPGGHEVLDHFDCNSNMAAPATDAVFGGTYALAALVLAAAALGDHSGDADGDGAAIAGAISAPFLASMVYGFIECSDCAGAKEQLRERQLAAERAKDRLIADLQRQLELARQPLQLAPAAPIVAPSPPAAAPATPVLPAPEGETAPALP
jgi:hypothetical protein